MKAVPKHKKLTVSRLAEAGGVGLTTVRFYQQRGLLAQPDKPRYGGPRVYAEADVRQLLLIKGAQTLGFTLAEIKVLIDNFDRRKCLSIKAAIDQKLQELNNRMREIRTAKRKLGQLAKSCSGSCIGECSLIERIRSVSS